MNRTIPVALSVLLSCIASPAWAEKCTPASILYVTITKDAKYYMMDTLTAGPTELLSQLEHIKPTCLIIKADKSATWEAVATIVVPLGKTGNLNAAEITEQGKVTGSMLKWEPF